METFGKNIPILVGHPFAPIGMGEHIRCSFRAFRAAGYQLFVRDIYNLDRKVDQDFQEELDNHLIQHLDPQLNIFHINGDEIEQALSHLSIKLNEGAYNIIYPTWELSIYPEKWAKQINRFSEIWAPSHFVYESLLKVASKPVLHMPLATEVSLSSFLGRRYFNLPESSYLFLFYFDFRSYIYRKNPYAAINAFEMLCKARPNEDMRMVIKLNRDIGSSRNNAELSTFLDIIRNSKFSGQIIIIDKIMTDNEVKNLVRCCDCFVSLHRSEGYGRGMAEAMFLGKPVIATGYSGNLDFMNPNNSFLVKYQLKSVESGQYPYYDGQMWADPDIEEAVFHMITLLDNPELGYSLGKTACIDIRTFFSYRAIGTRYLNRLSEITKLSPYFST
jgi:glycosyltransferase involved in cell wall biosynthesis